MGLYPLVGLLLGLAAWGVYAVLLYRRPARWSPPRSSSSASSSPRGRCTWTASWTPADGYLSGAPRERALEIMKDSRVGAMGVFAASP